MQTQAKFGSRQQFLQMCNPDSQIRMASNQEACYFGDYPTLTDINLAYGKTAAAQWLVPQLTNLSMFSGSKDITPGQLEELSRIIAQHYHYLKITELMLFFYKFKTGAYGKFYGTVDPLTITTALREFIIRDRNEAYARHEQEEREAREAEERAQHKSITHEEWLLMKAERENQEKKKNQGSTPF